VSVLSALGTVYFRAIGGGGGGGGSMRRGGAHILPICTPPCTFTLAVLSGLFNYFVVPYSFILIPLINLVIYELTLKMKSKQNE